MEAFGDGRMPSNQQLVYQLFSRKNNQTITEMYRLNRSSELALGDMHRIFCKKILDNAELCYQAYFDGNLHFNNPQFQLFTTSMLSSFRAACEYMSVELAKFDERLELWRRAGSTGYGEEFCRKCEKSIIGRNIEMEKRQMWFGQFLDPFNLYGDGTTEFGKGDQNQELKLEQIKNQKDINCYINSIEAGIVKRASEIMEVVVELEKYGKKRDIGPDRNSNESEIESVKFQKCLGSILTTIENKFVNLIRRVKCGTIGKNVDYSSTEVQTTEKYQSVVQLRELLDKQKILNKEKQDSIKTLRGRNECMEEKLAEYVRNSQNLKFKNKELSNQNTKIQAQHDENRQALKNIQMKLEDKQRQIDQLKSKIASLKYQLQCLSAAQIPSQRETKLIKNIVKKKRSSIPLKQPLAEHPKKLKNAFTIQQTQIQAMQINTEQKQGSEQAMTSEMVLEASYKLISDERSRQDVLEEVKESMAKKKNKKLTRMASRKEIEQPNDSQSILKSQSKINWQSDNKESANKEDQVVVAETDMEAKRIRDKNYHSERKFRHETVSFKETHVITNQYQQQPDIQQNQQNNRNKKQTLLKQSQPKQMVDCQCQYQLPSVARNSKYKIQSENTSLTKIPPSAAHKLSTPKKKPKITIMHELGLNHSAVVSPKLQSIHQKQSHNDTTMDCLSQLNRKNILESSDTSFKKGAGKGSQSSRNYAQPNHQLKSLYKLNKQNLRAQTHVIRELRHKDHDSQVLSSLIQHSLYPAAKQTFAGKTHDHRPEVPHIPHFTVQDVQNLYLCVQAAYKFETERKLALTESHVDKPSQYKFVMKATALIAHLHVTSPQAYAEVRNLLMWPYRSIVQGQDYIKIGGVQCDEGKIREALLKIVSVHRVCASGEKSCRHLRTFLEKLQKIWTAQREQNAQSNQNQSMK